jgi:uncharacterized protein (DUF2141 family)
MPRVLRLLPLLLAAFHPEDGLNAQAPESPRGALVVRLVGVRAKQGGQLVVALYDHEEGWLQLDSARTVQQIAPTQDSMVVTFDSLPFDSSYAITVIHDRNGNQKLDMRWSPSPSRRKAPEYPGITCAGARRSTAVPVSPWPTWPIPSTS